MGLIKFMGKELLNNESKENGMEIIEASGNFSRYKYLRPVGTTPMDKF
jgi:hypothetical protein